MVNNNRIRYLSANMGSNHVYTILLYVHAWHLHDELINIKLQSVV
jgi:hypothetical protein